MPSSTGISAAAAKPLSDWDHVQQSIRKILLTPIGSRVMRRDFGSELPDLIDRKMTNANILAIYSASARAIHKWEPRFRMQFGSIDIAGFASSATTLDGRDVRVGINGLVSIQLFGTFYPKGHLGDYSVAESATARLVYERAI